MEWILKRGSGFRTTILVIGEGMTIYIALILFALWADVRLNHIDWHTAIFSKALIVTLLLQASLYYFGVYDPVSAPNAPHRLLRLTKSFLVPLLIIGGYQLIASSSTDRTINLLTYGSLAVLTAFLAWRLLFEALTRFGYFDTKVILLGTDGRARDICRAACTPDPGALGKLKHYDPLYKVVAVADIGEPECTFPLDDNIAYCRIDNCREILDLAAKHKAKQVVVCLGDKALTLPEQDAYFCKHNGIVFTAEKRFIEHISGRKALEGLDPFKTVFSTEIHPKLYGRQIKRALDILVTTALLVLLAPILLVTALTIRLKTRKPALQSAPFLGRHKKIFKRYHFTPLHTDEGHTAIGPLQALPQLLNVLKGEMSLVGPRPVRPDLAEDIGKELALYDLRFTVRPGITGWTQIRGGPRETKRAARANFGYDLYYLQHMSLPMDITILLQTLKPRQTPTSAPKQAP